MSTVPMQPPTDDAVTQKQMSAQQLGQQPAKPVEEHTPSDPMRGTADEPQNSGGLAPEDQTRLMDLVRRYKTQWQQDRMSIVMRCMENMEFFKGNQYISFDPLNFQYFDTMNWAANNAHAEDSDDDDLYQYCNNFYQMLCTGFIAALSPQLPKATVLPEDAEDLTDVTTAKAAETLIEIIQRQNKAMSLLKQQLFYMFNCGAIFRHTRYVVDSDRSGTRKEPVYGMVPTTLQDERYHCFNCGADVPADSMAGMISQACPKCGAPLGPESYYPAETGQSVGQVGEEELPNGMVAQTIYSPLEVDCDPQARSLRQTPLLSLSVEVHLGALRASYPQMYSQILPTSSDLTGQGDSMDRTARQMVKSPSGSYGGQMQEVRPTLDRTWIQPFAFGLEDDEEFATRMTKSFPKGVLLVTTGDTFLEAREAKLTSEWTWAGTHEGLGLYPPAPGDIITPFQKRYNNACAILDDFMERCSAGVTLGDTNKIDAKSLNGKPLLPGVINGVKLKQGANLEQALYQFKFQLEAEMAAYLEKMIYNAQMFAGVPPQVYGGAGDPHIETMGGQEQQLQVALGKLNIYWDNLREENAEAAGLAVLCAKNNLTEDLKQVIQQKGSEYRNNYVRLDDLQGDVAAYPDTDQAFPLSAAELRGRWSELMEQAAKGNPFAVAVLDEPTNQEQAASALGVPGMVIPGSAMRSKVLQDLEQLAKAEPMPTLGPDGQPTGQMQPSVTPDREIDDFDELRKTVRQYCQENCDLKQRAPQGWANILAYLTAAIAMQTQFQAEQEQNKAQIAQAGMPPQPQAPPKPEIPPDEISKVVGRLNDLMDLDPAQTKGVIAGQVSAAGQLIKVGQSLAGK
ncbi:MAG: hypothetical protein ACJ71S_06590 [Acidobacteriaceae bacterium]|jgi:hypothetical protein